jgi:RNA polymerase sigma-70 factor (ECF subfamily)
MTLPPELAAPPAWPSEPSAPLVPALDSGLLRQLSVVVLRAVRQTVGTRDPEVEDLTQEALKALVVAWPHFRGECSPAHFARRITAQRCIDAIRNRRVRGVALAQLAVDHGSEPDARTWPSDRLRAAWLRALSELPPEQALSVTQRYVFGYTLEEIASEASVPLNTVKSRLRLAKHVLRAKVAEDPHLADMMDVP